MELYRDLWQRLRFVLFNLLDDDPALHAWIASCGGWTPSLQKHTEHKSDAILAAGGQFQRLYTVEGAG